MKYLLDTHAWIWWHMDPEKLSHKARAAIEDTESYSEILLSAISPWEFCKLLEKQRIGISCDPEEWLSEALQMPKLRLVPLTPAIAYRSTILPQPFHTDPADQIIAATAREENATIISKDGLMRNYRHVRTVW
ncbi:MAG: type II toxin-antitoxin system VapC family toxin [Lentisphaerae bacterium]|jgi:PIN domain nuclease of toxin-antitoxin system|nr:type II toxin-antitoxin system VapC family toxin [Lentisphaerota bacterium]MBT4819989.1 type II toxin-antitoxin system VapC family toxin [Lentisphaerota bacterium]MBT5604866.1 type II toxin-antitoxin system VapC family toxin [Lentisphaerota bacterium]MBT7054215.1 type II toxin-antitoxin system VapC family toxin [Lentisphaerota bacterium]MBT7841012.1 type II toxin-antitoxin system VapC family toxin [Lentisphaerota bacterium]